MLKFELNLNNLSKKPVATTSEDLFRYLSKTKVDGVICGHKNRPIHAFGRCASCYRRLRDVLKVGFHSEDTCQGVAINRIDLVQISNSSKKMSATAGTPDQKEKKRTKRSKKVEDKKVEEEGNQSA
jgi:hypothetical protein